jgi:hypothetical protein
MHTMEGWSWNTVVNRFIEIIKTSIEDYATTVDDLICEEEILQVRRLIYDKLQLDLPAHLGPYDQNLEEISDKENQRFCNSARSDDSYH